MTFLTALGEFPEMVLGLASSLGCALLLGFVCLRFLVGLMTRQQLQAANGHNGMTGQNAIDDAGQVSSILRLGAAMGVTDNSSTVTVRSSDDDGRSNSIGGPYLIPAAAARQRFARSAESECFVSRRVVELPQPVAGSVAQSGCGLGGDAA